MPFARRTEVGRPDGKADVVCAFPSRRHVLWPRTMGALIALVAFFVSLVAVTVGPALGEMLPSPLLLWLM